VIPVTKLLKLEIPHCKPLISLLFNLIHMLMLIQNKYVNNGIVGV